MYEIRHEERHIPLFVRALTFIYSRPILFTVTSECRVKRVFCKTWTEALANSADPDQTPLNAASDQGLRCLITGS